MGDQAEDVELALAERFPGRLPDLAEQILAGQVRGRVVIEIGR